MPTGALTTERILLAAEDVLRRHGPAKANVVDVARGLGVSHGSVYRHFPSKAALRDAVVARWLADISEPLAAVSAKRGSAPARLRQWLDLLVASKRSRALDDPELFAAYLELAAEARDVVTAHVAELTAQLAKIIADGVATGDLSATDTAAAARATFDATARFHNPVHVAEWTQPGNDTAYKNVRNLILKALERRH